MPSPASSRLVVIKNASILLGENLAYIEKGYIEIEDGIIKHAGEGHYSPSPSSASSEKKKEEVYDASGLIIMPAFINAHTHIADSIGKDIAVGRRLDAQVHPVFGAKKQILEKTPQNQLAALIRNSVVSMLQNGITTFADFREGGLEGVQLLRRAIMASDSLAIVKCLILGRTNHYFSDPSRAEGLPKDVIGSAQKVLEVADGLGISGANENTDLALEQYRKIAKMDDDDEEKSKVKAEADTSSLPSMKKKKRNLVAIHASESIDTVKFSKSHTGRSEVDRIMEHLRPDVLVHMTHATDDELSLVSKGRKGGRGGKDNDLNTTGIVVCPRANGVLGVGLPRVAEMLRRGCIVAIGTDNVMLNSPDMFREMDYLWKASNAQGEFIEPLQILKMATVNAAKIFGLENGWIGPKRSADLIFIDKYHVDLCPMHDPYSSIIHRASRDAIRGVMAGGIFAAPPMRGGNPKFL